MSLCPSQELESEVVRKASFFDQYQKGNVVEIRHYRKCVNAGFNFFVLLNGVVTGRDEKSYKTGWMDRTMADRMYSTLCQNIILLGE